MTEQPQQPTNEPSENNACSLDAWLAWKLLFGQGQKGWERKHTAHGVVYQREISPTHSWPITMKHTPYREALHQAAMNVLLEHCGAYPLYDSHKTHYMLFEITEDDYIRLIQQGLGLNNEGRMERHVRATATANYPEQNATALLEQTLRSPGMWHTLEGAQPPQIYATLRLTDRQLEAEGLDRQDEKAIREWARAQVSDTLKCAMNARVAATANGVALRLHLLADDLTLVKNAEAEAKRAMPEVTSMVERLQARRAAVSEPSPGGPQRRGH